MNGYLGFKILDTVYRKIYILKSLTVSSLFLLPPLFKNLAKKPLTSPAPWHIKRRSFWIQYTEY